MSLTDHPKAFLGSSFKTQIRHSGKKYNEKYLVASLFYDTDMEAGRLINLPKFMQS